MNFLKAYLRNLLVIALVVGGALIFTQIFYPQALSALLNIGSFFSIFGWWPLVIVALLVAAVPLKRR